MTKPKAQKLIRDVTRTIKRPVERELWARAGGRCQFRGHNAILYRSPLTQRRLSIAEKAHIYSFSVNGPRTRGPLAKNPSALNGVDNLLLVCGACHTEIDDDDGKQYPATLLQQWKAEHERRIELVTGIDPQNRTDIVIYAETIGDEKTVLLAKEAAEAVFPERYPANERPTILSMTWEGKDTDPGYWDTATTNLVKSFERSVIPLVAEGHHLSIFGFAPMPLLMKLGSLLTDKPEMQVHQRRREPQTWRWHDDGPDDPGFSLIPPTRPGLTPVLIFALSDHLQAERIHAVLGTEVSTWTLTVSRPHNDLITSRRQLQAFRRNCRQAMIDITLAHGHNTPLHVFPAMPLSTAIEFGRIRMPKAQMPWIIYDYNRIRGNFVKTITLE